jgi:hypothetical protein
MNKRGEKLMVFWWFLAIMFVSVLFVLTTTHFFAKPADVRGLQTEITYSNIYECLVEDLYLNSKVFEQNFDLSKFCGLREKVEMSDLKFLIHLDIVDNYEGKSLLSSPIILGDGSLYADCEITSVMNMKYSPNCLNRTNIIPVYYFSKSNERKVAFFNVVIASQYFGKRISIVNFASSEEGKK